MNKWLNWCVCQVLFVGTWGGNTFNIFSCKQAGWLAIFSHHQINYMCLLTEWEGWTGKYLARGHTIRTKRSEVCAAWPRVKYVPARPNSVNRHFIIWPFYVVQKREEGEGLVNKWSVLKGAHVNWTTNYSLYFIRMNANVQKQFNQPLHKQLYGRCQTNNPNIVVEIYRADN